MVADRIRRALPHGGAERLTIAPDRGYTVRFGRGPEVDLRLALGVADAWAGRMGTAELEENYARTCACCESIGDKERLFPAMWGLWLCRQHDIEYRSALAQSDALLSLAGELGDPAMQLQAHHASWTTQFCLGAFDDARRHAEAGIAIYDPGTHRHQLYRFGGHDAGVCARAMSGWANYLTGQVERARTHLGELG